MKLRKILQGLEFDTEGPFNNIDTTGLKSDSRLVCQGDVFVALKGSSVNTYKYIGEAVKRGAKVVIAEERFGISRDIQKIYVLDARKALPILADNFYSSPSENIKVSGVTGTNGKTTITYLMESIIKRSGRSVGVIGTINHRYKDIVMPARNTTPGSIELQSMLACMNNEGIDCAVLEISSHSLDQHRVDRVRLDTAIFTNITRDHLDYHKTMDEYFKTKSKIFDCLKGDGTAILNMDDDRVRSLKESVKNKTLTYGIKKKADITASGVVLSVDGSRFTVSAPVGSFEINTKLIGGHNISNILASVAASMSMGIDIDAIKGGIEALDTVPGRLEEVGRTDGLKIFVDYAHTDDALANVLGALREVAQKRIITVFGCGGDRDKGKRPLMGRAACRYSDHVILTSDNPRNENPEKIIEDIESGIKSDFSNYEIINDRRKAIERAISIASLQDIVIIAGKGHENCQIIKDKQIPFDDRRIAQESRYNET